MSDTDAQVLKALLQSSLQTVPSPFGLNLLCIDTCPLVLGDVDLVYRVVPEHDVVQCLYALSSSAPVAQES